jgi:hypothetical protein
VTAPSPTPTTPKARLEPSPRLQSNGTLYWYGAGGNILAEADGFGNTTTQTIFPSGKARRHASRRGDPIYYLENMLGTSRINSQNNGTVCYDADFDPYSGECSCTNTCPRNKQIRRQRTRQGNLQRRLQRSILFLLFRPLARRRLV